MKYFIAVLLVCVTTVSVSAQQWKGRTKRSSGDGGIIKIVSGANRTAAESALSSDPEATGETVVDIEKLDSNEASYRGIATQATLSTVSTNLATFTDETSLASNSSSTPLAGNATFSGTYQSVAQASAVRVSVLTDQNSATNGLTVSWSANGTDTIITESFTVSASSDFLETFPVKAAYVRISYTNGAVAQTTFALTTVKIGRLVVAPSVNNPLFTRVYQSNGTSFEAVTGNRNITLLTSASRTTNTVSADQDNFNQSGLHVVVHVSAVSGGDITVNIEGKDAVSGQYYVLLSSAPITTTGVTVLRVFPGATDVANQVANDIIPRTWRVNVIANNANPITYSIGASLVK